MSYRSLHRTIMEVNNPRNLEEKPVSDKESEDYDAQDVPEIDPGKKTANTADHKDNVSSVATKGTNDSIAEERSTFSEDSLNQLTRLFGGQPKPLTEAKDDDDKKKKDKKNPEKANDKIDTSPEVDDEKPLGEETLEELSEKEEAKKEEIVKKLKNKKEEFQKKYGDRWESVMYATATKMAKKSVDEVYKGSIGNKRLHKARMDAPTGRASGTDKEKARNKAAMVGAKGAVEREKERRKKAMKKEEFELTEEDKARYNKVFNAVAKHMNVDPKAIDELDKDKKKEFFDTVDKCWDSKEDKVPDGCPVDINLE